MKQLWTALKRWAREPMAPAAPDPRFGGAEDEHILALLLAAVAAVAAVGLAAVMIWALV
jgi:hypothetical protein